MSVEASTSESVAQIDVAKGVHGLESTEKALGGHLNCGYV